MVTNRFSASSTFSSEVAIVLETSVSPCQVAVSALVVAGEARWLVQWCCVPPPLGHISPPHHRHRSWSQVLPSVLLSHSPPVLTPGTHRLQLHTILTPRSPSRVLTPVLTPQSPQSCHHSLQPLIVNAAQTEPGCWR